MEHDALDRITEQWAAVHPDLGTEPMALLGRVHRLSQAVGAQVTEHFQSYGLSRGEYDVLASLRRAGAPNRLTPGQLQESLLLSSAGVTGRVDRLERRKLVRRLPDPDDGRVVLVELTPEGRKLVDRVVREDMEREYRWIEALSESERRTAIRILRKLLRAVEETRE